MTLNEIFQSFIHGKPIQRKEAWGKDVFIETNGDKIYLRRNKKDDVETLHTFDAFDRYFSMDDLTAEDWKIAKK